MPRKRNRSSGRHTWWGLVALLGGLAFAIHAATFLAAPPGSKDTVLPFEIEDHDTLKRVARRLNDVGLIRNRLYFVAFGRLTGAERTLKPGEYALSPGMRPLEILDRFRRGSVVLHAVTIPEGYTARQIAQALSDARLGDPGEFLRLVNAPDFIRSLDLDLPSLEGYLFPDTYAFPRRVTTEEIVRDMVAHFRAVYRTDWHDRAAALGMTDHQIVTLASIVEKETGSEAERSFVSAVFHNRLRSGMPLQSDPTVIYSIAGFNGNLTKVDLKRDSPYNTYRRRGLPPGPIANPGRDAIEAALYPAQVEYLYFVSKNDGTHWFSRSIKEHNRAVDLFQRRSQVRTTPRRTAMPKAS